MKPFLPLCVLSCASLIASAAASERPNILLIVADDMGFSDIGSYGSEIQTPNLDRLAAQGLRYNQFYNAARCCPTRASLLTGLYPHQTGIGNMVVDQGLPAYQGDLNESSVTIAQVLQAADYHTFMSGKWHVTKHTDMFDQDLEDSKKKFVSKHNWPRQRGFDEFFGTIHGAGSFFEPSTLTLGNEPVIGFPEDFYYTDAISDYAVERIRANNENSDEPFFGYIAYTAPHWPLHAKEEDIARFKGWYDAGWDEIRQQRLDRLKLLGIVDHDTELTPRHPDVPAWSDEEEQAYYARSMEVYAAQVYSMDEGIGRIIDALEETGELENTLILFISDNGGSAEVLSEKWPRSLHVPYEMLDGSKVYRGMHLDRLPGPANTYASYGIGWANASNAPFQYFKHYIQEGGIATPLIAYWPEGIVDEVEGNVIDQVAHVKDLLPTLLEFAGAEYPATFDGNSITPMEGISIASNFKGDLVTMEPIYWEHHGNRGVRMGNWKIVSIKNGAWKLYDMEIDRNEIHDLSGQHPYLVQTMVAGYDVWAKRVGVVENPPKPRP